MSRTDPSPPTPSATYHPIEFSEISRGATEVLDRLNNAGYASQLVGGCVRDLYLGHSPKDFDVATAAHPEQVREVFRRARLIGRRFKLVHVRAGREIIEVSTYRSSPGAVAHEDRTEHGRLLRDNVYGVQDDDVWRRDFTINALYYDHRKRHIVDYVGGVADLDAGVVRMIGNAKERCREDPVRALRAIRFAAALGFAID
ncbi:MAG: polynucleotide adenylyltransferase PcnB, partial [Gammaproteobacteria bacterium]|nr:polynucleotide adenylyltransferase PcnB [Gammaproteobacteria bacterium]